MVIYVAGNPDAYPIEYYNKDKQSFEGLIPDLLKRFSKEHGYELKYCDAGSKDQRQAMAQNCQVDLVSCCTDGERFAHTRETMTVLESEVDGSPITYGVAVSESAPAGLCEELGAYLFYLSGENYAACDTGMLHHIAKGHRFRQEFKRGLEQEEFQLYVQFYVDTFTSRVVGGEALSRWEHPERGLLCPVEYIPLLERNGLIDRLDYYTLDKVCCLLQRLYQDGITSFFISCNFSRGTFVAEDFVSRCSEIIGRYTFPKEMLVFELTESKNVKNTDGLKRNICKIKDMGIRIALDDFGEGFTSFFDIQEYALDVLKLDKGLIDHINTNPGDSILRAMIQVGHDLGMEVLAEGVETDEQARFLQKLSCDVIQGFRFHYPIPAMEARRWLKQAFDKEHRALAEEFIKS